MSIHDQYAGKARIIARVFLNGHPATTVQDVQQAWRLAIRVAAPELSWGQVSLAGHDDDDVREWTIRGLDPDLVTRVREQSGRFMFGTIGSSVWETTDSAEHGWRPS